MDKVLPLPEFQKFATYLLAQPSLGPQLKKLHFQLLLKAELPLFLLYKQHDLEVLANNSLMLFLEQVAFKRPPALAISSVFHWKPAATEAALFPRLTIKDIIRICRVRKQLFLDFIEKYTSDVQLFAVINRELDQYFAFLEEQALENFVTQKQEEAVRESLQNKSEKIFDSPINEESQLKGEELAEVHSLLQEVSSGLPHLVYVLDVKSNTFIYSNHDIASVFGYKPEEITESYLFLKDLVHPEDKSILDERENIYFKLNPGEFVEIKFRIQHKNGHWHWLKSKSKVFRFNDQRQPVLILGITEDITEVVEAEETIENASKYYLQILDDFPALIWRSGIDGACDYFNKGWLDFTGRSLAEEIGNGWLENVHPDDINACLETYTFYFNARKPFEMEYRLKRKDGQYKYIVDYGKPIYNLDGAFDGFVGSCFDIQERKDYQELISDKNKELKAALEKLKIIGKELKESNNQLEERVIARTKDLALRENFLNNIIQQSPVATWITDKDGTTIQSNKACLSLFGWKDESECTGKYNILNDEKFVNTPFYKKILEVFTKGEVARFEHAYSLNLDKENNENEEITSVIYTIFPITNPEGEITNTVIKVEDITDKKKAEDEIKRREEELRLITDSIPVLISYLDKDLRYRFVNVAYEKLFKQKRKDIIGKTLPEVAGLKAYKTLSPAIEKVFQGEPQFLESFQDYGELGNKYLSINFIPHISQEEVSGFYAMGYDISERKKTEQEIEALYKEAKISNEELNKINTDLDNFIYTASHDLKSPVANLEGLLILLERNLPQISGEKEQKIIQMMEISVTKLKKTINDLVEITKIQKDTELHLIEEVSFIGILDDIKVDLMFLIEETKPVVKEVFEIDSIKYAKSHLRSILYNLLSNAFKYRNPDKPIHVLVKTYSEDGNIVLLVKDNGLGMDDNQQKKLFTMFKRMHSHIEGTGIGLYTIKRIIENNGGAIEVTSKEGEGTQFKVIFKK